MKSWQPLLTGSLAERARQAVDEIAAVLAPAPAAAPGADQRPDVPEDPESTTAAAGEPLAAPEALAEADAYLSNPTLAGGLAGAALFFAYRAGRGGGPGAAGDSDAAALLLERCTEALATTPLAPDLYGGFSGVAWTAEHLYGPRFAAAPFYGYDPVGNYAIHILVKNRVVMLAGVVDNEADKNLAGIKARGIKDVTGVNNDLEVSPQP